MAETNGNASKLARYARVGRVFTPFAPVDSFSLFAGRMKQVMSVVDAINQRGQHAILYGERGVGKTSLANVLPEVFVEQETGNRLWSAKVNCSTTDEYHSLWANIFREIGQEEEFQRHWSERPPEPEDVRYLLGQLPERLLIVIDELDRLDDDLALSQLADTIKTLSDHSVDVTLVMVGVADSINELIGDHRSVQRNLVQVPMQRMSPNELAEIIDNGLGRVDLLISDDARSRIARLSEGLPFYTHLLALHAAQRAVMDDRDAISSADVEASIEMAANKAQHSILSDYQMATRSPRTESQFEQVLLACALAPKDDLGYFSPSAVREPLSRIMGRERKIASFVKHLNKFTEQKRGCILQRVGLPRQYFYRFENPLLQPFVILNGVTRGLIEEAVLIELQDRARNEDGDSATLSLGL
jgi:energy-coupling factor transporter ATP-binding protein EcfA2